VSTLKTTKIGSRGFVFTFDDLSTTEAPCPTNVYLIAGRHHLFLCDTFLGPESMKGVRQYIKGHVAEKPLVIFNSHYDYDHHWGNCAFTNYEMILSSSACKERIAAIGEAELKIYENWKRGDVKLVLPTEVFEKEYVFTDDGVKFFHSPGHTQDSSSCYDEVDQILFVADNVETPIPYVRSELRGVKTYVETLKAYLEYDFKYLIPGHGSIAGKELLESNLSYLESLLQGKTIGLPELEDNHAKVIHLQNLYTIAEEYNKKAEKELAKKYYWKLLTFARDEQLLKKETMAKIEEKLASLEKK